MSRACTPSIAPDTIKVALPGNSMGDLLLFDTEFVAQIEFTEWTPDGHLRHSKFVGFREDKEAGGVVREPDS